MQTKAYSVRDSKAEIYNQPFFQKSHGEAERTLLSLVKDGKSMISQYPDDYDLYFIGTYDDQTGVFSPLNTPQHMQKARHVLDAWQNNQSSV